MLWGVGSGVREALLSGSDPSCYSSAAKHMLTLEALKLATTVDDLPRVEQALLEQVAQPLRLAVLLSPDAGTCATAELPLALRRPLTDWV